MIIKFKFQYKIKENENCFSYIPKFTDEIDNAAQEFLDQFEFIPSDALADKVWDIAIVHYESKNKIFEDCDEAIQNILDDGVPFTGPTRNGSLWYSLGFSPTSNDAHLRNLYENLKNGTDFELPFPICVPKNIDSKK